MERIFLAIIFYLLTMSLSAQNRDSLFFFERPITWNDFKDDANYADSLHGAVISVSFVLQTDKKSIWTGRIKFKSSAVMYPQLSWVQLPYKNDYGLEHEKVHFVIAEICAKKLEDEINKMKITSATSDEVKKIFDKWYQKMSDTQLQYDLETDGSKNLSKQIEWNREAWSELHNLQRHK
jgi:hypothetical protein